jgi:hypothetical protein
MVKCRLPYRLTELRGWLHERQASSFTGTSIRTVYYTCRRRPLRVCVTSIPVGTGDPGLPSCAWPGPVAYRGQQSFETRESKFAIAVLRMTAVPFQSSNLRLQTIALTFVPRLNINGLTTRAKCEDQILILKVS